MQSPEEAIVNHARTLLMNVNGDAPPADDGSGEEIVDPEFRALSLPTPLDQIRRALFGTEPDRYMMNYRCRQLLALVHATPLVEYILKLDARITYDFSDTSLVPDAAWRPEIHQIDGTGTLTVLGDPDSPDASGRVRHSLLVSVNSPGIATVERLTTPFQKVDLNFTPMQRLALSGTGVDFRLSSDASGQAWSVRLKSRPHRDLGDITNATSNLGEPVYNFLFGITREEPYKTFRELWTRKRELPLRLGALVCALVYRTEESRRG